MYHSNQFHMFLNNCFHTLHNNYFRILLGKPHHKRFYNFHHKIQCN